MKPMFLDPSVLLLAVGGEHRLREPCRQVLKHASEGRLGIHLSTEGGQEFLFHRMRRTDRDQAVRQFDLVDALAVWHPFDVDVLHKSRDLVSAGHALGRDAVHAATAILAGFVTIVSCDADFDNVPGLARLDPVDSLR